MPGYVSDLYSAFYPLSVASPALGELQLEDHGLRWTHAPAVVGHARDSDDDDAAVIFRDINRTASELNRHSTGDGQRWGDLFEQWEHIKTSLWRRCSRLFRRYADRWVCCAASVPPSHCDWRIYCCCPQE